MTRTVVAILAVLLCALPAHATKPDPVIIAAASDMRFALPALIAAHGVPFSTTFGSSGKLAAQIENGAPFDAFFAASAAYVAPLAQKGLVRKGSRFVYGVGRLVLWTPAATGLDAKQGMKLLANPKVAHIAIANPAHAPYGAAAEATLRRVGLWDTLQPKIVRGENIAQAHQLVTSGAAQAGFVALALVVAPDAPAGSSWEVPAALYPKLSQEAVILNRTAAAAALEGFFAFVKGSEGKAILKRYGFKD